MRLFCIALLLLIPALSFAEDQPQTATVPELTAPANAVESDKPTEQPKAQKVKLWLEVEGKSPQLIIETTPEVMQFVVGQINIAIKAIRFDLVASQFTPPVSTIPEKEEK